MSKQWTRRDLLRGGAAALALSALPWWQRVALADQAAPSTQNLIMVFASGGWDATIALDPKPGMDTIDVAPGTLRTFGNTPIWTGDDRPAVTTFFEDFGSICAVVNGIGVRSIAHEECTKRIMTGTNSDASPDIAAIAGVSLGSETAVPYMVLGQNAYPGQYGGSTGRAGSAGQLVTLLDPRGAYSRNIAATINQRFDGSSQEEALIKAYAKQRIEADKAKRAGTQRNARKFEDLALSLDRRDKLKPLLNSVSDLSAQLEFPSQIEMSLKVLKEGISRTTQIQLDGFDTHSENNLQQAALHQVLYTGLHALMSGLEREGLLANTTVVVLSEMSRTPQLNESMGKDHWPVTSALVLGANVAGGRAHSATDDQFQSMPINLQTGMADQNGQGLTSASFAAGVIDLLGVDTSLHFPGVAPLASLKKG